MLSVGGWGWYKSAARSTPSGMGICVGEVVYVFSAAPKAFSRLAAMRASDISEDPADAMVERGSKIGDSERKRVGAIVVEMQLWLGSVMKQQRHHSEVFVSGRTVRPSAPPHMQFDGSQGSCIGSERKTTVNTVGSDIMVKLVSTWAAPRSSPPRDVITKAC